MNAWGWEEKRNIRPVRRLAGQNHDIVQEMSLRPAGGDLPDEKESAS